MSPACQHDRLGSLGCCRLRGNREGPPLVGQPAHTLWDTTAAHSQGTPSAGRRPAPPPRLKTACRPLPCAHGWWTRRVSQRPGRVPRPQSLQGRCPPTAAASSVRWPGHSRRLHGFKARRHSKHHDLQFTTRKDVGFGSVSLVQAIRRSAFFDSGSGDDVSAEDRDT